MKEEDRKNNYTKKKIKSDYGSSGKTYEKSELSRQRIIQKNLLYVIGLAPEIAREDILSQHDYLGQYGKIAKIVVNRTNAYNPTSPNGPSYSAYVTFSNERDTSLAIYAINDFRIHNREIKASFGTTKYCSYFLADGPCPNSDCLYLHSIGKEKESYSKEFIVQNKNIFSDQQRIAINIIKRNKNDITRLDSKKSGSPVFPSVRQVLERLQSENTQRKASDYYEETNDKSIRKYSEDIAPSSKGNLGGKISSGPPKKRALINTVDFNDLSEENSTRSEKYHPKTAPNNEKSSELDPNENSHRTPMKGEMRSQLMTRLCQSESKTTESSRTKEWKNDIEPLTSNSNEKHNSLSLDKDNDTSPDDDEDLKPINFLRAQSSPGGEFNLTSLLTPYNKEDIPDLETNGKFDNIQRNMTTPDIKNTEDEITALRKLSQSDSPANINKNERGESPERTKLDPERELKNRIRNNYLFSSFEKKDKSRFEFAENSIAKDYVNILPSNGEEETEDEHSLLHRSLLKYLLDVKLEDAAI